MSIYSVRDLVKKYPGQPHPANAGVSLELCEGEIFGLLGDNGAGKTTLVRQMVNLLRPDSGSITLFGRPAGADPLLVSMNVGYMPQETHALNNLTVAEALYFTAHLRGCSRIEAQKERERLLDLWDLHPIRNSYSTCLSGGQRRLLRLAVAMSGSPPVLILDEPTNDLDPQRRRLVWDVIRQVNRENGTAIFFITHDAIEAEKVIQRVGIMKDGRLAAVGSPAELKRQIDQKLRLELFFAPENPPNLPPGLTIQTLQPGRCLVYLNRADAAALLDALPMQQIDDFRLYSATLEDLYMHYAHPDS